MTQHRAWQHRASLNTALEAVGFCPRCGQEEPMIDFPRSIVCDACGYAAFYNPKPVACAIVSDAGDRLVLMRRATEPRKGAWTLPGGFVDLGEAVEDAARREIEEEVGLQATINGLVGVYSKPTEHTVKIVYAATTEGTPRITDEALEVRAFDPMDIPWQALAFWSDAQAIRDFLSGGGNAAPPR